MEFSKETMYLNAGFGNPHIGFAHDSDRPSVEIGGKTYAIQQVSLKTGAEYVLVYESWGGGHAPMCTCGKMYMFYSYGRGWNVDEKYMPGFTDAATGELMTDIVRSAVCLFRDELRDRVDARYGTRYAGLYR